VTQFLTIPPLQTPGQHLAHRTAPTCVDHEHMLPRLNLQVHIASAVMLPCHMLMVALAVCTTALLWPQHSHQPVRCPAMFMPAITGWHVSWELLSGQPQQQQVQLFWTHHCLNPQPLAKTPHTLRW
jgi:hypothetical protein